MPMSRKQIKTAKNVLVSKAPLCKGSLQLRRKLCKAKAFPNRRHCRWFSFNKKLKGTCDIAGSLREFLFLFVGSVEPAIGSYCGVVVLCKLIGSGKGDDISSVEFYDLSKRSIIFFHICLPPYSATASQVAIISSIAALVSPPSTRFFAV